MRHTRHWFVIIIFLFVVCAAFVIIINIAAKYKFLIYHKEKNT